MELTKCEIKPKNATAAAIAELMKTWNDVMAKFEEMWPEANAASVYTITAAIMNKELKM